MGPHLPWKKVWKMKIPSKFKLFHLKILKDCLPTKDLLSKCSPSTITSFGLCHQQRENSDHLFLSRPVTVAVCRLFPHIHQNPIGQHHFSNWFWHASNKSCNIGILICWFLWKLTHYSHLISPDAHELYIQDLGIVTCYHSKLYGDIISSMTEEDASSRVPHCHLMSHQFSTTEATSSLGISHYSN